jgi:hypothetical protein
MMQLPQERLHSTSFAKLLDNFFMSNAYNLCCLACLAKLLVRSPPLIYGIFFIGSSKIRRGVCGGFARASRRNGHSRAARVPADLNRTGQPALAGICGGAWRRRLVVGRGKKEHLKLLSRQRGKWMGSHSHISRVRELWFSAARIGIARIFIYFGLGSYAGSGRDALTS